MINGRHFDTDLAVVGAGPAGISAAIWAALNGLSVIVIESKTFPRPAAGESLHPGIEILFRQLGVLHEMTHASAVRPDGHTICAENESHFSAYGSDERGKWRGYQILRETFDNILLKRAKALGVEVIQPCVAVKPIVENNIVVGVETLKGRIKARYVLDGAGGSHWLARHLNEPVQNYSKKLMATYGYAEVVNESKRDQPIPLFKTCANGWIWMSKIDSKLFSWTRLGSDNSSPSIGMPEEWSGYHPVGKSRSKDVTWRLVTHMAGQGFFIAGDGAFMLDPASSKGVFRGLYSGILAAHAIRCILMEGVTEKKATDEYQRFMSEWFYSEVSQLTKFYSRLGLQEKLVGNVP